MSALSVLRPYFLKYKWHFFGGVLFILLSNYFAVLSPQLTGTVIDMVHAEYAEGTKKQSGYTDPFIVSLTNWLRSLEFSFSSVIALCAVTLLVLALLRGLFMFFMRQTLIVMSRRIEYDQKNHIYNHYQLLDTEFYKTHQTGDLMNRISEDVSRVRMYTGPALMYLINLTTLIAFTVYAMVRKNADLTLLVLAPLPVLAFAIYWVNKIINKKSEQVQGYLSRLTVDAQQAYSGIRVIKSFVQEKTILSSFIRNSESYRVAATDLNKTEAIYFPSMAFLIGVSTLLVISAGGYAYIRGEILFGDMAAFIMYLTMLTFPVSAIGWVASTIQRASASQKRINEFLNLKPSIPLTGGECVDLRGQIVLRDVHLSYAHSGVEALHGINMEVKEGQKVAIVGRTGSGKSSLLQLLLRSYDPTKGEIQIDGHSLTSLDIRNYRAQIGYVPQESFLFSDTICQNILFGKEGITLAEVEKTAAVASVLDEIRSFEKGFDTIVGERGVTLSGGQKQRISLARALVHHPRLLLLDDCLSAVDYQTENAILKALSGYWKGKTVFVITNRIFSLLEFDKIYVLEQGKIAETGTHQELLLRKGLYYDMYTRQQEQKEPSI